MKKRILIVDDSPVARALVKSALRNAPEFEVIGEATNGREAIEKCLQLKPDIVTLDLNMPIMNGLDVAKSILASLPTTKILLLSAMGDADLLEQFRALGVVHSVQKPFSVAQLLQKLRELG